MILLIIIIGLLIYILSIMYVNRESFNNMSNIKDFLKNKTVLIVGSTGGLGYDLANLLSKYGSKLIITGKDKKKVQRVEEELKKINEDVIGIQADFTNPSDIKKLFNQAKSKFKKINVLITFPLTSAGSRFASSKDFSDWKHEQSVNLDSVIYLNKLLLDHMKYYSVKGNIINVTTNAVDSKDSLIYSESSKLIGNVVEQHTIMLAEENHNNNISFSVVRVDKNTSQKKTDLSKYKYFASTIKSIENLLNYNTKNIIPIFIEILKSDIQKTNGKIYTYDNYNDKTASLISPKVMKSMEYYKITSKGYKDHDESKTYLVKQNPFGCSPKIKEYIKHTFEVKTLNTPTNYNPEIIKLIAKRNNISENNIFFFKTEDDAFKKIIEIFVPKMNTIISEYPCCPLFFLQTKNSQIEMKYIMLTTKDDTTVTPELNNIKKKITSRTKLIYISSPNTVSGQSITSEEFDEILKSIPEDIIILIDQRYVDFVIEKKVFNPLKYLNRNIIILRSFNNFYGIENLELSYIISNQTIIDIFKNYQYKGAVDKFNDDLACIAYKDKKFNKNIREKIEDEKSKMIVSLDKNGIKYIPSETNYMLIDCNQRKDDITSLLEKENIILYESNDGYDSYFTLPISDSNTNTNVLDVLILNS